MLFCTAHWEDQLNSHTTVPLGVVRSIAHSCCPITCNTPPIHRLCSHPPLSFFSFYFGFFSPLPLLPCTSSHTPFSYRSSLTWEVPRLWTNHQFESVFLKISPLTYITLSHCSLFPPSYPSEEASTTRNVRGSRSAGCSSPFDLLTSLIYYHRPLLVFKFTPLKVKF